MKMRHNLIIIILFISTQLFIVHQTKKLKKKKKENKKVFKCPSDGKWPDPWDCGRFHKCNGDFREDGWCGPGMAYDPVYERCDMASSLQCNNGERPDWEPPDNWPGKDGKGDKKKKKTKKNKKSKISTTISPSTSTTTTVNEILKEGRSCHYDEKYLPNPKDCNQYFVCVNRRLGKFSCPRNELFDEETRKCTKENDVECGERPVLEIGKNLCDGRPNGVYPNVDDGCTEFYQCINQKKTKSGQCPNGLKFNVLTMRCDWIKNVPQPCGQLSMNSANNLLINHVSLTLTIQLLIIIHQLLNG
ncbi:hypothetical protein SNEBB_000458 [Seison nebaliae]|nr:hypothetical protein SNEBB_000458 [Seison nebaliae]